MPHKGQRFKLRRLRVKPRPQVKRQSDPLAHLPLLAYMNAHLEWMQVVAYSAATVNTNRHALRRFIAWCDERGLQHPSDITKQVLERYQRHLFYYRKPDGKPLSVGTQAGHLAPLVLWFKWLARQNHILYNPASELDFPREGKRLPLIILSVVEVEALLAETDVNLPSGVRDRALLEMLYSTGLRRMEAANLAVHDIDFNRRLVGVREGKGRRDRVVPVGDRALAWLDKYVMEARPHLLAYEHAALFVNDWGEPALPQFISDRVKKYLDYAGITKPGAAHLLRHAHAGRRRRHPLHTGHARTRQPRINRHLHSRRHRQAAGHP
jgi:integrase/recombinase XerD